MLTLIFGRESSEVMFFFLENVRCRYKFNATIVKLVFILALLFQSLLRYYDVFMHIYKLCTHMKLAINIKYAKLEDIIQ